MGRDHSTRGRHTRNATTGVRELIIALSCKPRQAYQKEDKKSNRELYFGCRNYYIFWSLRSLLRDFEWDRGRKYGSNWTNDNDGYFDGAGGGNVDILLPTG